MSLSIGDTIFFVAHHQPLALSRPNAARSATQNSPQNDKPWNRVFHMGCFGGSSRGRRPADAVAIGVSCVVSHAISESLGGTIACVVHDATPPLHIEWSSDDGGSALLALSDDRLRASNVAPGVYRVYVEDADGRTAQCVTEVSLTALPTVVGYRVTHASCDAARDGKIEVLAHNLRGHKFLWTNGVITVTPELHDASPGLYTATPLHEAAPFFIHACAPALVLPSRDARDDGLRT